MIEDDHFHKYPDIKYEGGSSSKSKQNYLMSMSAAKVPKGNDLKSWMEELTKQTAAAAADGIAYYDQDENLLQNQKVIEAKFSAKQIYDKKKSSKFGLENLYSSDHQTQVDLG